MTMKRRNQRAFATLFTVALLSAGCASVDLQSHVAATPEQALEMAGQEDNRETAQRYLLRVAGQFQDRGDHAAARKLLQSEMLAQLSPALEDQRRLMAMASINALQDSTWAKAVAVTLAPDSFMSYSPELLSRAANLQAETFSLADDRPRAAMTLILLAQTDSSANPQALHDQIWQLLKSTSGQELADASTVAIGFETQGWMELASTVRSPGTSLDDQGRIIRQWQNNWPGHPAAQVLPSELQLIASLAESRPEKIALALPLDGALASAGKAIRDGFIAAYYMDQSADRETTDIRIVNSSEKPFSEIYQELSAQGVDLIIGPLEKDALISLSSMNTLPTPTLGLNYLPTDSKVPDGLYQFGLSAEDEARQIADQLSDDNIHDVLALIPQGEWGDRVEAALLQKMGETGGTALDIERFFPEDNLRAVTADLLGITVSRDRAIQVERTIGLDVEFEPRLRQDAEAIVMVANPTIARQFKPLFAFYFGGELPVYSPSMVYEGAPDSSRDRDLENVIFTDTPWTLSPPDELKSQADKHLSGTRGQLGRLFAMGADAWQLSKRLPLLRQVESASLQGYTGELTMTSEGSVHRKQLWARFKSGTPTLIEAPAPKLEEDSESADTTP